MTAPAAGPIFLVGFMGSGKSRVGEALARRLGRPFWDTDRLVEREEGRTIERIFAESGEGRFREAEWRVLLGLAGTEEGVVATGGGMFLGAAERRLMRERGCTIWLDVSLEECRRRVGSGQGRPRWPAEEPLALRALFERRRACYALAELRVDGHAGTEETVRRVLDRLDRG